MKQLKAMQDTIELLRERSFYAMITVPECSYEHLKDMEVRARLGTFSEAKMGRWLGYIQGVGVSYAYMTLEEAKEINKRWAGEG